MLVNQEGELNRLDYSAEGWVGPPVGTVGQWQSDVPNVETTARTVDPDALLAYFEQVLEDANPGRSKSRMSWRCTSCSGVIETGSARTDDDGQFLQLVGSRGEGPFEVRDQQLSDDVIKRLQAEIHVAMQTEWKAA